ncbi:MAG: hypothetical protein WC742_09485 [Gallionellaceae bacterium]|jgi:hypothetical protein
MNVILSGELPREALLNKYKQEGAYTDCYFIDIPRAVSQAEYVEAFYTTKLFKVERLILALLARRPSTDAQAKLFALGEAKKFAAWSVEGRAPDQLLLCDFLGRTRSWLMSAVTKDGDSSTTRLYFGSVVVPKIDRASGRATFGIAFHLLSGFHRLYSRALLRSACLRLLHSAR